MVLILLNFETKEAKVFGKALIFIWYLLFNDHAAYTRELSYFFHSSCALIAAAPQSQRYPRLAIL